MKSDKNFVMEYYVAYYNSKQKGKKYIHFRVITEFPINVKKNNNFLKGNENVLGLFRAQKQNSG